MGLRIEGVSVTGRLRKGHGQPRAVEFPIASHNCLLCAIYARQRHHSYPVTDVSCPIHVYIPVVSRCVCTRRVLMVIGESTTPEASTHPPLARVKVHPLNPQVADDRCVVDELWGVLKTFLTTVA